MKNARSTADGHSNFLVRLPDDMLAKLKLLARANLRSSTAEIAARLAASMANESIDEHGCIVVHVPATRK